ncbi:hypothetical protein QAD02_000771 [Eretmocerus hayati]|uniref:Uncharacterized protein n=1 Tax=Eretmocerus hayati TaxID=131215 RepID=A0ACC2NEC6_9HYME|nr:hypothetical protein QAD02_000771 [Eretmocerus hayati]
MQSHLFDLVDLVPKDKHKLTRSDLKPNDEMNFKSVLKLCSDRTIAALKKYIPRSEGTQIYLTCLYYILISFLGKDIGIEERVYKLFFALDYLRLWRTWILSNPVHKVEDNFITHNTYTCIELNAHCMLQTIFHCIEVGSFDTFLPWLIGSQSCESFFRVLRTQVSAQNLRVNCTVKEGTEKLSKVQLQQDILNFDFKQENMDIRFPRNRFLHPSFETKGFRNSKDPRFANQEQSITLTLLRNTLDRAKNDA